MLRPHKNSDLHCAHREHQKVRLIDSIISSFENSLLLKSLDLINNRKKKKRYCGDSKVKIRLCRVLCEVFDYKSSVIITICLYIFLFWFKLYALSTSSALCAQMLKLVC